MRSYRLALIVPLALVVLGVAGCGSNSTSKTEAEVYLTGTMQPGPADVDMATSADVSIATFIISSHAKSPTAVLSAQDDVMLDHWVVTCTRSDGGTVASPQWTNFESVYVPAGGSITLSNYRIYPAEFFKQPPLNQLLPENGNVDKETGNRNIREKLHVAIYGKTVAGKGVVLEFDLNLNFFYVSY
jgi:hypothetical protein